MNTSLTLIADTSMYLPNASELKEAIADLEGLIRPSTFGQITIANAGACTFNIREAGDAEATPGYREVVGVIMASNDINILWEHDFNARDDNEQPLCRSFDGIKGTNRDTGEIIDCASCPYNQFDSVSGRKKCSNQRRLYIMRPGTPDAPGDLVPIVMTLPPSALKAFNDYRVYCRLTARAPMYSIVTKITLQNQKSRNGKNVFSKPVFTPVGKLSVAEAQKIESMVASMMMSANAGMAAEGTVESAPEAPVNANSNGFTQVEEDFPY